MKLKQFLLIILSLSFASLIVHSFYSHNFSATFRNLLVTEEDIQNICKGADWDSYQIDGQVSLTFYSKAFNALTKPQEYLLYLIQTEDLTKLKDYVISFAPLIIFVSFAYGTMILWMIYIACAKYPRYCFKRPKQFVQTGKGRLFFILLHGCFGIVIICSIFGYIYSNHFSSFIKSATCALTASFNDFVNGQPRNTNTTIAPTWIGINKMEEAIYNTMRSIDQMRIVTNNIFSNCDWTTVEPLIFDKQMINLELDYLQKVLPTPNPQNERVTIRPEYLQHYASAVSGKSFMRGIQVEYENKIRDGTTSIVNLRKNFAILKDNYQAVKATFTNINIFMKSMLYYFKQINETLLTEWVKYFKMANVGFHVFFLFLFAFQTFCAVGQIVFFYLLNVYNQHRKKFQIVINVLWNAYAFSIIFSFMSGFGFIVTSYASNDALQVLSFIFGRDNLLSAEPVIISNSTIGSYLHTCLHSDGNLAQDLHMTNTVADSLNVLYSSSYVLRNTKQVLYQDSKSRSIPAFYQYVDAYKADIHKATNSTYETNDVTYVFNEWSKYTSSHYSDYQSLCETTTLDKWVGLKQHCPNNYTYIKSSSLSIMDKGEKRCLVYDEWNNNDLQIRYKRACELKQETPGSKVQFYTTANATSHYFNTLLIFKDQNLKLINDIVTTFTDFEIFFNSMSTKLLDNIKEVEPLINISYDTYHDFVGDNEMYSMMNCKYFQGYFSKLYFYLRDKVAPSAMNMGIFMIINSIFGFLSLLFLFFSKAEYIPWDEDDEEIVLISSFRIPISNDNVKETEKMPVSMIDRDLKPEMIQEKNNIIENMEYIVVEKKVSIERKTNPNPQPERERGMISYNEKQDDKSDDEGNENIYQSYK